VVKLEYTVYQLAACWAIRGSNPGASVVKVFACWPLEPKIAGSLPTEVVGFFVMEKSTARSTIGRERTIEHNEHETNK
jgi:hypothetical protein